MYYYFFVLDSCSFRLLYLNRKQLKELIMSEKKKSRAEERFEREAKMLQRNLEKRKNSKGRKKCPLVIKY